jgi:hypothetical protein
VKTYTSQPEEPVFFGVDYHKRHSVFCVIGAGGEFLERGRIEHETPEVFGDLIRRWRPCRVVFEASMNWHWLYELLEAELAGEAIVLANAAKTRIIAEAQVKTDKVDAFILAQLLHGNPTVLKVKAK